MGILDLGAIGSFRLIASLTASPITISSFCVAKNWAGCWSCPALAIDKLVTRRDDQALESVEEEEEEADAAP